MWVEHSLLRVSPGMGSRAQEESAHGMGQGQRVGPSSIQPASGFQLGHQYPGGAVWLLTGYVTPLVFLVNSRETLEQRILQVL